MLDFLVQQSITMGSYRVVHTSLTKKEVQVQMQSMMFTVYSIKVLFLLSHVFLRSSTTFTFLDDYNTRVNLQSKMKIPSILPTLLASSPLPAISGWSITFGDQIFHDNDSSVCFRAFIANSTVIRLDGITDFFVVEFSRDNLCRDIAYSWNADGVTPAMQETHSFQVLRVMDNPGLV